MLSKALPKIEHPLQKWEQVCQAVTLALEDPATSEECENLVGSLGPVYEDDPELINGALRALDPETALNTLMEMNPGFNLNLPPREIVASVVETLMSLTPKTHQHQP